jgi:CDP-diacylglycerol pyrophosphatase
MSERRIARRLAMGAACVLLLACRASAADPDALWNIVHGQCVPNEERTHDPAPCAAVDLAGGDARGFAVLKDRRGATQYLLIPTARISGIESPVLLSPDAPSYWQDAWDARRYVSDRAGRELPRDAVGLAINSAHARTQEQLHIHVDCLRPDVRDTLRQHASEIGREWAVLDVDLAGHRYRAMRVMGEELGTTDPFRLLVEGGVASTDMGGQTLVVAGAVFPGEGDGFVILADRFDPITGDFASGESLLDHSCALAAGAAD